MSDALLNSIDLTVRPYKPSDQIAVQEIFLMTAYNGHSSINFIDDGIWLFDVMVSCYLKFERDLCFVAELGGHVVGYLTGCGDTTAYHKSWRKEVLPRVLRRFFTRGVIFQSRAWNFLIHSFRSWIRGEFDLPPMARYYYPAHFHINVRHIYQDKGIGRKLVDAFLAALRSQNISGVLARTSRAEPSHPFFEKLKFTSYSRQNFTLWEYLERRPFHLITYALALRDLPQTATVVNHV